MMVTQYRRRLDREQREAPDGVSVVIAILLALLLAVVVTVFLGFRSALAAEENTTWRAGDIVIPTFVCLSPAGAARVADTPGPTIISVVRAEDLPCVRMVAPVRVRLLRWVSGPHDGCCSVWWAALQDQLDVWVPLSDQGGPHKALEGA